MKNKEDRKKFFGLNASEKARVVKEAVTQANKEQLDLVNKYGGIEIIKEYCKCD